MSTTLEQVSPRTKMKPRSPRGSVKHPLVPGIRVPLTDGLNRILWALCLKSGLTKSEVASLVLSRLNKQEGELQFNEASTPPEPRRESPEECPLRTESNLRYVDVLVSGKTLLDLKHWAKEARITVGETAALILMEATCESVDCARVSLEKLKQEPNPGQEAANPKPSE